MVAASGIRLQSPMSLAVGCEAFARMAWHNAAALLEQWRNREVAPLTNGVRLVEVEVREHGANSAIYTGE
jgi:hypothetical protein